MDDHGSISALFPLKDIIFLLLGTFFGGIIAFAVAAYFDDRFYLPYFHNRYRLFPEGKYNFYAPSREIKDNIIHWNARVYKNRMFKSCRLELTCKWIDTTYTDRSIKRIWKYAGSIVREREFSIARLDVETFKKDIIVIDNEQFTATTTDHDPCFIIFHRDTEPWSIRPCIVTGYDAHGNCYSAVGILSPEKHVMKASDLKDIFGETYFLDYRGCRNRIYGYLFPKQSLPSDPVPSRDR